MIRKMNEVETMVRRTHKDSKDENSGRDTVETFK